MATSPPSDSAPLSYAPGAPRAWRWEGVPLLVARLLVGGFFIVMGWRKVSSPVLFLKQIHLYDMIPDSLPLLLNTLTVVLPWIEIVCGALLVLGIAVRGASALLVTLLAVFSVAIFLRALGIYHESGMPFCSIKFDCGCGTGEEYICRKLPENLALMALAVVALFSRTERFCLWRNLIPAGKSPWNIEGY